MEKRTPKSAEEEYLKTVLVLSEKGGQARTRDIARGLGLAPASVTQMLEKLAKKGHVRHRPYHGAELTAKGRAAAEIVLRRYRLLERFFVEYLGIPQPEASRQSCLMEHCISKETERRICQIMRHPELGLDSRPMPRCRIAKDCESCMRAFPPPAMRGGLKRRGAVPEWAH